jgi:hypothetical protein
MFQAGLNTDIFTKARLKDGASAQGGKKDSINNLPFLAASGTFGVPLGSSNTNWQNPANGLHHSGNWLTQSGTFGFGASGSVFPFLPPLEPSLPVSSSDDSLIGSPATEHHPPTIHSHAAAKDQPKVPEHEEWRDDTKSNHGLPVGTPHGIKPQAMSPFFQSQMSKGGEQPMAFWKLATLELVSFNEQFAQLIEQSTSTLQSGFLWSSIGVVDQDAKPVHLHDEGNNALKAIYEFTQMILAGNARYSQISFSFLSGNGKLRHMHVTMVAFNDDALWLCTEIGGESSSSSNSNNGRRKRGNARDQEDQPQRQLVESNPNERKLVKVATRKKKPWDVNLVKFSLKKMRKRSKRAKAE